MVESVLPPALTVTDPVYQPDGVPGGTKTSTHALALEPAATSTGKALRVSWKYASTAGTSASGTSPLVPLASLSWLAGTCRYISRETVTSAAAAIVAPLRASCRSLTATLIPVSAAAACTCTWNDSISLRAALSSAQCTAPGASVGCTLAIAVVIHSLAS